MSDPATPSDPEQPDRPDSGQSDDTPDDTPEPSGTPASESPGVPEDARELDEPRAKSDRPPDTAGDAWASSVDKPSSTRQPMGFSSPGSSSSSSDDDDDDDDFGELGDLGGMLQQLLGGLGGGAGGSGQMPDLGELFKMLGGAQGGSGQLPDLGELMRQFGGLQGQGLPGGAAGMDQLRQLWKQLGIDPDDPSSAGMLAMVQQQVQQFLNPKDAGDRRRMETDLARKTVATETDPVVTAAQQRAVGDAVRLAQLWLDPVTTLDPVHGEGLAWSRSEWVEATMPKWHELVEPVADGVTLAMTTAMDEQFSRLTSEGLGDGIQGLPEIPGLDLSSLLGQLQPALKQLASGMFSAQLGNGVGALAADLLTATEVGLPLLTTPDVALLPTNIAPFTEGSGIDANEVLIYLAVRESARARLFAQVPWLGPQLEAAVRDYARNIRIDTDAIEEQMRSIDLQNIGAMQEALSTRLFSPTPTREQQAALTRLETSLAIIEGWVDLVTDQATSGHLPHAEALGEAVRRRRVSGPAQKTFGALVGLELRPRRLKDATNLWAALENAGGKEFRDAPWAHPDLAPTAADLDDPLGYVEKRRDSGSSDDLDSALDALLGGADGSSDSPGPSDSAGPASSAAPGDTGDTGPSSSPTDSEGEKGTEDGKGTEGDGPGR